MNNKHWYSIGRHTDSRYEISTCWSIEEDANYIAEEAALDFHSEHDGWDNRWPLILNLHKENTDGIFASFSIERDFDPVFTAYEEII